MASLSSAGKQQRRRLEESRVNIFLHTENRLIFGESAPRVLPVTIVTGYLGSGKTTLLTHILSNRSNLRVAALINDFASLNIDEDLINAKGTSERVVELSNGCVCCHLIEDMETVVWDMLKVGSDVDLDNINYLVVETSGVSDPARIIQSLEAKFGRMYRARLDSVVTVIDADLMAPESTMERTLPSRGSNSGDIGPRDSGSECLDGDVTVESSNNLNSNTHADLRGGEGALRLEGAALSQIECADIVLLNKTDLAREDRLVACERIIAMHNPAACVYRTAYSKVPLEAILDVSSAPTFGVLGQPQPVSHEGTDAPFYVSATGGALRRRGSAENASIHIGRKDRAHGVESHLFVDKFRTLSVLVDQAPLELWKLQRFLHMELPAGLVRMKGVLWVKGAGTELDSKRFVVHMSGRFRLGFEIDGRWEGPPSSKMAFIGRDLDATALEAAFQSLRADPNPLPAVASPSTNLLHSHIRSLMETNLFEICQEGDEEMISVLRFRLTGAELYGYSVAKMRSDLRMDVNSMNRKLADWVNLSTDRPKAFMCYDRSSDGSIVLCHAVDSGEIAGNFGVLLREGRRILESAFRNIAICPCGQ